jgi:ribonuclease-3 family protein
LLMPETIEENELKQLSATVLAFIGDAVFELLVRSRLVAQGHRKVRELHLDTVARVKATSQARMMQVLSSYLTEAEQDIFRRGRNAKSSLPRNADMADYRLSTGFEAVLGYLYLKGDLERLQYLAELALNSEEQA